MVGLSSVTGKYRRYVVFGGWRSGLATPAEKVADEAHGVQGRGCCGGGTAAPQIR